MSTTSIEPKVLRQRLAAEGVHTLLAQFTDVHVVAKGKRVPHALLADALEGSAPLRNTLGETLNGEFLRLKRVEVAEHARHVGDWELARYAAAF